MTKKYIFVTMRRSLYISVIMLMLIACKKKSDEIVHTVQFSSNITDPRFYSLTINETRRNDISATYNVETGANIILSLMKDGGDTASVDAGDSLWVRGGITVDGRSVKSYAGYSDATLSYQVK